MTLNLAAVAASAASAAGLTGVAAYALMANDVADINAATTDEGRHEARRNNDLLQTALVIGAPALLFGGASVAGSLNRFNLTVGLFAAGLAALGGSIVGQQLALNGLTVTRTPDGGWTPAG